MSIEDARKIVEHCINSGFYDALHIRNKDEYSYFFTLQKDSCVIGHGEITINGVIRFMGSWMGVE